MFTLSDASKDTKKILKWLGISLAVIVCLFVIFKALLFIKEIIFPTPPPKPTVAFGKLQPSFFPQNKSDKKFTYSINTNSGKLPTFADQEKVFVINPNEPDLLALNKLQDRFYNADFAGAPVEISNKIYRWQSDPTNRTGIPKTITGDIVDSSFTIESGYISNPLVLSAVSLPDEKSAIDLSSRMLQNMDFLTPDLDLTKTKTKLFSIENNSLKPATSLSNSQIVEVDYYQKDVNKLPIFYEDATSSNIQILVAGGITNGQVVAGRFVNQAVSKNSSTYPIISADEAYDKLKIGKGYISAYFGTENNISITNVFLAYYISSQPQDFAIPVYVFEGNDGFYAYVVAVKDEWISK